MGLEQDGAVAELRNSVAKYLENRKKHYKNDGKRVDAINLERDVRVDITCTFSDDAIIAASNKECMLYFVEISLDRVGVSGSSLTNSTHSYPKDCRDARDMFFSNGSLFIANDCKNENKIK